MYKAHGINMNGIDTEVIRNSPLGAEGWALHNFGDDRDKNISDYDDTSDHFPEHRVVEPLIKHPSAPLGSFGLAPIVADGHRAGDDHGKNTDSKNIAPLVSLADGLLAPSRHQRAQGRRRKSFARGRYGEKHEAWRCES